MKMLQIDWTRCDGHGLCAQLNPDRITLDDWGYPIIIKPSVRSADDLIDARRAVAACPALALRLERVPELPTRSTRTR
jgi:ferredoxin